MRQGKGVVGDFNQQPARYQLFYNGHELCCLYAWKLTEQCERQWLIGDGQYVEQVARVGSKVREAAGDQVVGGLRQGACGAPAQPGTHIQVQVAATGCENALCLQLGDNFHEDEGTAACPLVQPFGQCAG